MAFKKAERSQIKLKLAIDGPSGAGKTFTSLLIASGFVEAAQLAGENPGRIAFIDTENETSAVYSDLFDFDLQPIKPPFTVKSYLAAVQEAISAGYEILVIDSISHEWSGKGGLLEQKEILDSSGKGSSYTNWSAITKQHNAFLEAIVQAPIHIISTMRSKQDYILTEGTNAAGKAVSKPQKVGLAPIQRDGTEYEFYTVLSLSMNHSADCSKDRTGLFDGRSGWIPNKETGKELRDFLRQGKPLGTGLDGKMEKFTAQQQVKENAKAVEKDHPAETKDQPADPETDWVGAIEGAESVKALEALRELARKKLDQSGMDFLKPYFEEAVLKFNGPGPIPPPAAGNGDRLEIIKAGLRDCETVADLNAVMKSLSEAEKKLVAVSYGKRLKEISKGPQ